MMGIEMMRILYPLELQGLKGGGLRKLELEIL